MTKPQISLLGSLLAAGALAVAGCGSSSPSGGTGGKADGGGTGGKGGSGAGGHLADAGTGGAGTGGHAADAGTGGSGTDAGSDVHADTGTTGDTHADTGPCTTSFGSGSQLLFSFDKGANAGWSAEGSLASTLSSDATSGNMCPGELSIAIPFMSYGDPAPDVGYAFGPARDWSAYGKLHAFVKLATTNFAAVNGVQIFVQSNGYGNYTNGSFTHGTDLMDGGWHQLDVDFATAGTGAGQQPVLLSAVNKIGIQILVQGAPTEGGIPSAAPVTMYVDDIWLEAKPPAVDAGSDISTDTGTDVPAPVDTGVDIAPIDTGIDVAPADATPG